MDGPCGDGNLAYKGVIPVCQIAASDLHAVFERLKDRYPLTMTNTFSLDDGFTEDLPILVGQAHGQIIYLYDYYGEFVMDVMDFEKTMGTHWHPVDIDEAVEDIIEFMEGKADYYLTPFAERLPMDFILDTDAGGDCDDMMALAYLVYASRHLNVRIKAVTNCNACPGGPDLIRTFFEQIGAPVPLLGGPVGNAQSYDNYCSSVVQRFGSGEIRAYPDAVTVLRRALAESENAVLCAIGPFNNIAALLESQSDEISPLNGIELMREKCAKLVVMAGGFTPGEDGRNIPEWNALVDVCATQAMVKLCPVPIVFLPFETGLDMLTGGPMMDKYGENTPLSYAYVHYADTREIGGRHSWDPATAVYAVEGCRYFFDESPRGTVTVDDEGRTVLNKNPGGLHSVLTIKPIHGLTQQQCKERIAEYIDRCALIAHDLH